MSKKHFYSEIVTLDSVVADLDGLDLTVEEKKELKEIAHDHLHETILDAILSELSEKDKKIFLANTLYDTNEMVWKHLNKKVDNIEEKIKNAADKLKSELRDDVKKIKAGSSKS